MMLSWLSSGPRRGVLEPRSVSSWRAPRIRMVAVFSRDQSTICTSAFSPSKHMRKSSTTSSKRPLKTLERAFSKAGVGSRTEARSWIGTGRVRVNGRVIQNPEHWVDLERDQITLDGKPLRRAAKTYILLYKPKGYLTTYRDPEGRPTVYDLIQDAGGWLVPVGRLDLDTSGLLLLTNDTDFADRVMDPEYKVPKTYQVKTSTRLTSGQI